MQLKIEINLDNAAFDDPEELTMILRRLSERMYDFQEFETDPYNRTGICMDSNGNRVGHWRFEG